MRAKMLLRELCALVLIGGSNPSKPSQMSLTNRFFIYAPFALFVVLALGLTIRWFSDAEALSLRLDKLNGSAVMPGVTLHFGAKRIAGFPFRLDVVFKHLEIEVATPHGTSSWHAEDFALHRLTYGADKTLFEAAGRQSLSWSDEKRRLHTIPFAAGSMRASAIESEKGLLRFDLEAVAPGSSVLSAEDIQLHIRKNPARDALDLFVAANNVTLGPKLMSAFGRTIAHFTLSATLSPEHSLAPLLAGRVAWPTALASAQRVGGTLDIDQLLLGFDRLEPDGKGTLSLDSVGRPQGVVGFKVSRYAKFLAAEQGDGAKSKLTKAFVDRAAKAGSDEMGRLGIVVGAKDGIVYAGDEPVGTLSPVY